ncbi:hypothetical protein ANO11243_049310 [Dothideomycetidae sp. 11243]|nr:hypothetical protein ANO11243_049310 [fungal sp. No.11243]
MADYGNDPTEVAVPYHVFSTSGFSVTFATETGTSPACDERMLSGISGALLGATAAAKTHHAAMLETEAYRRPVSWSAEGFSLLDYDLVFLPGGHDKHVRPYIDSATLHAQLGRYMAAMRGGAADKNLAAICHGVQVLAHATDKKGKSLIHDVETTALMGTMETSIFWVTRPFLGDYYKTYGAGTPSVEESVKAKLDSPETQWKGNLSPTPFTHRDPKLRYISARFPPDAEKLAKEAVEMVKSG